MHWSIGTAVEQHCRTRCAATLAADAALETAGPLCTDMRARCCTVPSSASAGQSGVAYMSRNPLKDLAGITVSVQSACPCMYMQPMQPVVLQESF